MKHLIVLLLLPLLLVAETFEVKPGESITKVMLKTNQGDTIKLIEGEYEENLVLNMKTTLIGAGPHKTILIGDGRENLIELKTGSSVSGVTITGGGTGVISKDLNVKITNCIISNNRRNGVTAVNQVPFMQNVAITSNGNYGIQAMNIKQRTRDPLSNLTIYKNQKGGIYFEENSLPQKITASVLFKNGFKEIEALPQELIISESIIYPMTKGFEKDNVNAKPKLRAPKAKKPDYRLVEGLGDKGINFEQ